MKIGISAQGNDLDSQIDPRFGRAQGFIIADSDSLESSYIENKQNLNAPSGAGIQAAQTVAQQGVDIVITGNCGPKAFATLQAAKIKVVVGASGTIRQAIEDFKKGDLKPTESANVEGHWM